MNNPNGDMWKILLVDDDEDDYIITRSMLNRPAGRKVALDWASSYETGQQMIQSNRYDAVLVDYDLGHQTGIELIRAMVAGGYSTPLILYTGRGTFEADVEAMQAGATLYLSKTEVNPLLLERSIRYAIERKQFEEQLAYQAELLANVYDPVVGADAQMRISYWNKAAEETFGWTEAEAIGRDFTELIHTQTSGPSQETTLAAFLKAGHGEGEVLYRRKDGSTFTAHVRSSILKGSQGESEGLVISVRDITERKLAEDALAAAMERQKNELDLMKRLRTINLHLIRQGDMRTVLDEIVETAMDITHADKGTLRLFDHQVNQLRIAASQGFEQPFLDGSSSREIGQAIYDRFTQQRERLLIEDVSQSSPILSTSELQLLREAGVHAFQTTPLLSHTGHLIGLLSTHFCTPMQLDERDLSLLDLLAQQTADSIERIQVEQALQESEERFRLASKAVPGVLYDWTIDRTVVYQSEGLEQVTGYKPGEEPGGSNDWWPRNIHPDDYPAIQAELQTALDGKTDSLSYEYRIRHADGHWVYILDQCYIVRDQDGTPQRIIGTATDITKRRLAEQAMRESEARLNRSQEIAHLGSWELDLLTNQLTWSNEVYRIFGLQPQEFGATYEAFLDAVHPDDRAAVDAAYSGSLREGRDSYEIEHRVVRKDTGEVRTVHEKCEHIRDNTGQIIRSIGMVHDITERKRAEEALRELSRTLEERFEDRTSELRKSEERFHALVDAAAQIIWTLDEKGFFVDVTPSWLAFTGQTIEEAKGLGWLDAVHPDDRENTASSWRKSVETPLPVSSEVRLRHIQGGWRWTQVRVVPLFHPDGSVRGWVGMSADITEQQTKIEQAMQGCAQKLERANRELEQLAFAASHDLQESLHEIRETCNRLYRQLDGQVPVEAEEPIREVKIAADRMQAMIDELLKLSEINMRAGKFEPVNLTQIAENVVFDLEDLIRSVDGQVLIEELPTVEGDALLFRQLLQNLVVNGLTYHKPETPPVVRISSVDTGNKHGPDAIITVTDNGIGFEKKDAERIYRPFQRLHGSNGEGMGMGLALCKKIAERHGGSITAESVPGQGSTFIVTLPVKNSDE